MEYDDSRIEGLISSFNNNFTLGEKYLFSSPGRIEIVGNHTDHNNGRVVAAAIDLDSLAVVSKNDDMKVNFISKNLDQSLSIDLNDLKIKETEKESTASLIRGVAKRFVDKDYNISGFNCVVESQVAIGSGLSSSASIEVLIAEIFNDLYNEDKINPIEIAQIAQYAENYYFGKPCGLMDQLAISYGGIVGIDFADFENPVVDQIEILEKSLAFVIVSTGGSHADLTNDYASIPEEMKLIAKELNAKTLRSVSRCQILENIENLREKLGDRVILRALHFFAEDERAGKLLKVLKEDNINEFLELINSSGSSSAKYLQNSYSNKDVKHQGITLAIELTEQFINYNNIKGAVKVHGGGFAGTILTVLDNKNLADYKVLMKNVFGTDSVTEVFIRNSGAEKTMTL